MQILIFLFCIVVPPFAFSQGEPLNFEEVLKVLETHKPNTVAKALHALKARRPDYFERYALVVRSMSIQGANLQSPRVVLFDQEARLVISFNGDPAERGHDRLEVMRFDETKKAYDFREIKFFGESNSEGTYEISESGGVGGRCLRCHGRNALPIWDSYPFWPDYYGSTAPAHYRKPSMLGELQQKEVEAYTKFVASAKDHARYKVLPAKTFSTIANQNTEIGNAFAERVREVAASELTAIPDLKAKLAKILYDFRPSDFVQSHPSGVALPKRAFEASELAELSKLSEYQNSKIVRYARNYELEKLALLGQVASSQGDAIAQAATATGLSISENKLQLWTYTQIQPADLILVPRLREALGEDVLYLNSWSIVPGRRFIDFAHPDNLPYDSGIENALADLL